MSPSRRRAARRSIGAEPLTGGVGDRDEEAYQQGQQPSIVVVDRSPGEPQPSSSHQAQASTSKAAQSSSTFVASSSNGPSASAATTPAPAPVAPSRGGVRRSYQRQDTFDLTRASTKRVERLFAPSSGSDNENLGESSGAQVVSSSRSTAPTASVDHYHHVAAGDDEEEKAAEKEEGDETGGRRQAAPRLPSDNSLPFIDDSPAADSS